jgi:hypothetical protein
MIRLSRYAAVAAVMALMASSGAPALADVGGGDMDIRLLCHEQVRQGWPCDGRDVQAAVDFAYRTVWEEPMGTRALPSSLS